MDPEPRYCLYLDVCCLNRPFDDQTQPRIRLEAEAVLLILARVTAGEWIWLSSEVVDLEVARAPDLERRRRVELLIRRLVMTLEQIRQNGLEALARELGPVGMVRFLQQFENGAGDYTSERQQWLSDEDVLAVVEGIRARRRAGEAADEAAGDS